MPSRRSGAMDAHVDRLTIEIIRQFDLTGFVVLPGAG